MGKKTKFFFSILSISICYLLFFEIQQVRQSTIISPLAEAKSLPSLTPSPTQKAQSALANLVTNELNDSDGVFGIVIQNLKTHEQYKLNEHKVFEPASLYKLWVMATVMDQVDKKTLSFDQRISDSVQSLNTTFNIDPELAELTEGTVSFTVEDALEQMITISHNYAALLLGQTVRLKTVQNFLDENGFIESKLGEPPEATASDIAEFYEKLYTNQLVNKQSSLQMIDLLTRQKLNNKIPKYIPSGIKIAHKTGELGTYTHDAGIIYGPKTDYILVILADNDIPTNAEETISNLSKRIYKYFEE